MKRFGYIVLLFMAVTLIGTIYVPAQTQHDMSKEACEKFQKADQDLNRTYNQILNVYKDDREFLEKLKVAQRAWIAFRDAHLASIFPKIKQGEYGSVKGMCRCNILADFTSERTKVLSQWLTGVEEGETCAGSIKSKEELPRLIKKTSK